MPDLEIIDVKEGDLPNTVEKNKPLYLNGKLFKSASFVNVYRDYQRAMVKIHLILELPKECVREDKRRMYIDAV